MSKKKLRKLEGLLRRNSEEEAEVWRQGRPTAARCLGKATGLTKTDVAILELLLRVKTHSVFESMIDDIFERPRRQFNPVSVGGRAVPLALGLPANTVQLRLTE